MPRAKSPTDFALAELRAFGLGYPGAHTKSPWPGHLDLAVNDKTFAYLGVDGEPFSISCKLPRSASIALLLPFASPTGYGLGKSGWVSASFPDGRTPPVDLFKQWIDESYRAQAPKRLVASLAGAAGAREEAGPGGKRPRAGTRPTSAPATKRPPSRTSAATTPATRGNPTKKSTKAAKATTATTATRTAAMRTTEKRPSAKRTTAKKTTEKRPTAR